MLRRRAFLLLLPLFLSRLGFAESRIECSAINSQILKRPVRYCVLVPVSFSGKIPVVQRFPILYFLHGLGNNEQTLFNSGGWNVIQDLRHQQKIGDFFIVAPEGGSSFFINSADGKNRYSDFLLQEFIPNIEKKYPVRSGRGMRGISGISMGGYGALRLAFAHPELFGSVSAESAALIPATPGELNAAIRSGTPLGNLLGPVFGTPIDQAHWRANDPLVLARKNAIALRRLAIYFNCGRSDDLGFENGAEALHRELQSEKVPHQYHLYAGDHSLDYFLSHLGEVMEFHWKAFEAAK
jgi:S-formylglutathione hydrolase FrmB